jgi:hypothetical protein
MPLLSVGAIGIAYLVQIEPMCEWFDDLRHRKNKPKKPFAMHHLMAAKRRAGSAATDFGCTCDIRFTSEGDLIVTPSPVGLPAEP